MDETTKSKSFFKRPETPMQLALYGGLGVLGFWAWGKVSGFVLSTISNTFWAGIYLVGLALLATIAFSPKTHMILRLISRKITGLVIELDPIGILKDRVAQMMKRKESFSEKKAALSGAKQQVDNTIKRNANDLVNQQRIAGNARSMYERANDPTEKLRGQTEMRIALNEIQRLELANKEYANLSSTLGRIQDVLERGSIYLDGYIRDGMNEARQWEIKRKTSGVARGAISDALSIIRGKASENDIYQATLDHLADEYDMRLGQVDDGLRDLESFMTKVDLQTGLVDEEAFALIDRFEKKLALPARAALIEVPKQQSVQSNANEYARLFGGNKKE